MVGRPWIVVSWLHVQRFQVREKPLRKAVRELPQGNPFPLHVLRNSIIDIGEVHHVGDLESPIFQIALENVGKNKRSEIADVREVVDGGTAAVDADMSRIYRFEGNLSPRGGIVKSQHRFGFRWRQRGCMILDETTSQPPSSPRTNASCNWSTFNRKPGG